MTGMAIKVKKVAEISPPMTTTANGFWVSDPMPVESAAGSNPNPAIKAVMTMGRTRDMAPSRMAVPVSLPSFRRSLKTLTKMTPF